MRSAPKPVNPVFYNGIRYEAADINYIAAYDSASNRLLWKQQIYKTQNDSLLEPDVQWIFVKSITIKNDSILITNEIGEKYTLPTVPVIKLPAFRKCTNIWADLLNNQSIAAFLGAMFAFLFMIILDLIRKVWQKKSLNSLIDLSSEMVVDKMETVNDNITSIKTGRELMAGGIMLFLVDDIMRSFNNVYDVLSSKRKMSIYGIVHRMKGIDEILLETNRKILEYRDMPDREKLIDYSNGKQKGDFIIERILLNMEEVYINMDFLQKMLCAYKKREFDKILGKGF